MSALDVEDAFTPSLAVDIIERIWCNKLIALFEASEVIFDSLRKSMDCVCYCSISYDAGIPKTLHIEVR